jgi:hypothetical protein
MERKEKQSRVTYSKANFFLGPPAAGVLLVVPAFPKAELLPNPLVVLDAPPKPEPPKPPPPKPPPPLLPSAKLVNEKSHVSSPMKTFALVPTCLEMTIFKGAKSYIDMDIEAQEPTTE